MTSLTDLREVVDVVIGVDTHVHTHSGSGHRQRDRWCPRRDHAEFTVAATAAGYAELVEFANGYPMMRACVINGRSKGPAVTARA